MKQINKSWRWRDKSGGESKGSPPLPPTPKDSGEREKKRSEDYKKAVGEVAAADKTSSSSATKVKTNQEAAVHHTDMMLHCTLNKNGSNGKNKEKQKSISDLSEIVEEAGFAPVLPHAQRISSPERSGEATERVRTTLRYSGAGQPTPKSFVPNSLYNNQREESFNIWNSKDDAIIQMRNKILQKKLYAAIERIGTDFSKEASFQPGSMTEWDMRMLLERRFKGTSLSHCRHYLERELVIVWLDTSGSCSYISSQLREIAKVLRDRHDVAIFSTSDICLSEFMNLNDSTTRSRLKFHKPLRALTPFEQSQDNGKMLMVPLQTPEVSTFRRAGLERYIYNSAGANESLWLDLQALKGKQVLVFSDSDAYPKIRQLMWGDPEIRPKKLHFFDYYNYYRVAGFSSPTSKTSKGLLEGGITTHRQIPVANFTTSLQAGLTAGWSMLGLRPEKYPEARLRSSTKVSDYLVSLTAMARLQAPEKFVEIDSVYHISPEISWYFVENDEHLCSVLSHVK